MSDALFRIDKLRVAYPHQRSPQANGIDWAVDGVSLELRAGERLGLVGESGCGKSTLGRAAMRLLPSSTQIEGQVWFDGEPVLEFDPQRLRRFRGEAVALVFQDPMTRLDPLMTIGDHCLETLLAHEPNLSKAEAKARAIATLESVNIPASRWGQYPHEFSGGMRQRVAIALALLLNPRLIVADEPTTSLDVTVSAQILRELTRLCAERQMALILISHDLTLVGEYCDRIAVMQDGKVVETGATQTVMAQPQHPYTRSLLEAAMHLQSSPKSAAQLTEASSEIPPLLDIRHLTKHYTLEQSLVARLFARTTDNTIRAVDDVSFSLYPGEILGLVGESGCGKSTLSRTILQLIRPTSGQVAFLGTDLAQLKGDALRAQRRQMQLVFQDPHACLNPLMTVGELVADPLRIHHLAEDEMAIHARVAEMLERVGLSPAAEYVQRYPGDLSGGQQQRVAIARALITRPKLLICDEPVSMLDASIQSQVLELMLELKREFDLTYLFITHDLWLARFLCDRIAVMQQGKLVEIGPTEQIFNHPSHPYTRTLLEAAPLLGRLTSTTTPPTLA